MRLATVMAPRFCNTGAAASMRLHCAANCRAMATSRMLPLSKARRSTAAHARIWAAAHASPVTLASSCFTLSACCFFSATVRSACSACALCSLSRCSASRAASAAVHSSAARAMSDSQDAADWALATALSRSCAKTSAEAARMAASAAGSTRTTAAACALWLSSTHSAHASDAHCGQKNLTKQGAWAAHTSPRLGNRVPVAAGSSPVLVAAANRSASTKLGTAGPTAPHPSGHESPMASQQALQAQCPHGSAMGAVTPACSSSLHAPHVNNEAKEWVAGSACASASWMRFRLSMLSPACVGVCQRVSACVVHIPVLTTPGLGCQSTGSAMDATCTLVYLQFRALVLAAINHSGYVEIQAGDVYILSQQWKRRHATIIVPRHSVPVSKLLERFMLDTPAVRLPRFSNRRNKALDVASADRTAQMVAGVYAADAGCVAQHFQIDCCESFGEERFTETGAFRTVYFALCKMSGSV